MRRLGVLGALVIATVPPSLAGCASGPDSHEEEDPTGARSAETARCPVSQTRSGRPPGVSAATDGWVERQGLWVWVGLDATVAALPRGAERSVPIGAMKGVLLQGNSVYAKLLWRRDSRAWGRLRIRGHLRSDVAKRLDARIGHNQGRRSRFVPSSLVFPSEGCWSITATSGAARLRLVLRVVRLTKAE